MVEIKEESQNDLKWFGNVQRDRGKETAIKKRQELMNRKQRENKNSYLKKKKAVILT